MIENNGKSRVLAWCAHAAAILAMVGCATPSAPPRTGEVSFDQAVAGATDDLFNQTQKLPGFLAQVEAKINRRVLVIDPVIDAASGQQTAVSNMVEQRVAERVRAKHAQFDILPFQPASLSRAQYLLTGTFTRVTRGGASNPFQLNLALTELKSGVVVAHASALARDDGLDTNPTPYYRDSPVLVKDKVVDGYVRTSETAVGKLADAAYIERVYTATLINEATNAYNGERYQEALTLYRNALATPAGEQLRVLNGLYLAHWKLGHAGEAEQAFGRIVAFGLANNTLGIKFLFRPGSTDFWTDPKVSGPYALWLRQIARQTAAAKACMKVIGHTSRTGAEDINDRLSQQRAMVIKQRLDAEVPELAGRIQVLGMGFRENLVGTGTDDARDALDRRVEFKIVGC